MFRFRVVLIGSSPRVWGQACFVNFLVSPARIIPTRMGTSSLWHRKKPIYEDHPHAYGDKPESAPADWRDKGSSPRVWGQETFLKDVIL